MGLKALTENRHGDVMKSCGTAIGGGASDRSPSVDLSAPGECAAMTKGGCMTTGGPASPRADTTGAAI